MCLFIITNLFLLRNCFFEKVKKVLKDFPIKIFLSFYLLKIFLILLRNMKRKFGKISTPRFINTHIIEIMITFERRFYHLPKQER